MLELGTDIIHGEPFCISLDALRRHIYLCGATGTGKTTLLDNLMQSLFAQGQGFAFIDPHGDEAERIADSAPDHRLLDIIYLDPADLSHSIAYNPLESVPKDGR